MRIGIIISFLLCTIGLNAQVDPEQIYQAPGRDYVLLSKDTNNSSYPINGIYVPVLLRDSLYIKSDSLCHGIFGDGRPDPCVPLGGLGCITVVYGNGDSTNVVCLGDSMYINYPETGVGGGDTTYYWVRQVNGIDNDTMVVGELENLVAGTNITITKGATNITFDVPNMRDTCIHTLSQLTDTTAALLDCNGVNRGTVTFAGEQCLQDMIVANGTTSDTVFLTYCDGTPKDTAVYYHATFNDSYADSASVWNNDTVMVYRRDTSGIIDSFPIVVPQGSINDTIYQQLSQSHDGQTDTIFLSDGGFVVLHDSIVPDTQSLSISGHELTISRGNTVILPDSVLVQNIIKTGQAVLLSDASPLDTIADLEEEGVVYWGNGEWQTDSSYFRYNARQLVINQGTYESASYNLGVTGGVRIRNNPAVSSLTRLSMISADGDEYAISVNPLSGGIGEMAFLTPVSQDGRGAFYIEDSVETKVLGIFNEERIGFHVGLVRPTYPLESIGDWWMRSGHIRDINQSNGIDHNSILGRGDGGMLWKQIAGGGGIVVDADADSIIIRGVDRDTLYEVLQIDSFPDLKQKYTPYQLVYPGADSILTNTSAWDSLRLMNEQARWMYLNDTIKSMAWGEGARADFEYSSAYGYNAFPLVQDTFPVANETVLSSQIDTVNERVTGLSTWIAHLVDSLGYSVGQNIVINVTLNSGQMPFIDSAVYMAEGLTVFNIASTSTLAPVYFEFDSIETGEYNFIAHLRGDSSTAIGAFAVVDKPNQIALGSDNARELKAGQNIRFKIDTFYTSDQMIIYDTLTAQMVPIGLDSLGEKLGIVLSTPTITKFELEEDDSLALELSGIELAKADLSKFNVSITGDSIYQGDSVYALPGDSLGRIGTPGRIVFETATKAPASDSLLFWDNANNQLAIGHASPGAVLDVRAPADVSYNTAYFDANQSTTGFTSTFSGFYSANSSGVTGSWARINLGTGSSAATAAIGAELQGSNQGDLTFWARGTGGFQERMRVLKTGQVQLSYGYTTGTSFAGTDVGVLGYSSSGALQGMDATDLKTFIGATDATSIANTQVAYSDGSSLVGDADMTFTGGNTLTIKNLVSGSATGDQFIITNGSRQWQWRTASTTLYIEPGLGDVTWLWRDLADANIFSMSSSNKEADYYGNFQFQSGIRDNAGSLGTSGMVLTTSGTGVSWANPVDNSPTNEIQNLSIGTRTATTYPINISAPGTGTSLGLFTSTLAGLAPASGGGTTNFLRADGSWAAPSASGGGIYGGSGTLPSSTVVTADIPASSQFNIDYNSGGAEFSITSSGTFVRHSAGVTIGDLDAASDELKIDGATGAARIGHESVTPDSRMLFYGNGNIDITTTLSGDNINISSANLVNVEDWAFIADEARTDVKIGASTSAQLVSSTSTGSSKWTSEACTNCEVEFYNTGNDVRLTATSGQIRLYCGGSTTSPIELQSPTMIGALGGFPGSAGDMLHVQGTASKSSTGTAWISTSDRRIKTDIANVENPYDKILALRPVKYRYTKEWLNQNNLKDRLATGYIAQEYQKVFPEDVIEGDSYKGGAPLLSMAPDAVGPYAVAAVQQLIKDKEQLERTVDDMREVITRQEDRLLKLEKMIYERKK